MGERDYIAIRAVDFMLSRDVRRLGFAELGHLMERICIAVRDGDDDFVLSHEWVDHVRRYATPRTAIPATIRAEVLAGGSCAVCGAKDILEVDHIMPWSRGGTDQRSNLQALCVPCNRSKGAKTMEEWLG